MTALSRTSSSSIFDSHLAFDKGPPRPRRPEESLRALQHSLAVSAANDPRRAALPDLLRAVVHPSGSAIRSLEPPPASFSLVRSEPPAISISTLATAASARSDGFGSLDDEVTAGTLSLSVKGAAYNVTIAQGATLNDVVGSIRALGADLDATVESDGGALFLRIKNRGTGFDRSRAPDEALVVGETSTGTTGKQLGVRVDQVATNAVFSLNGVTQVRTQNQFLGDSGNTIDLTRASVGLPATTRGQGGAPPFSPFGRAGETASRYLIAVESLAQAAELRSAAFGSQDDRVKGGTLALAVEGKQFNIAVDDGDTLARVRQRIEDSGAAVRATLVTDAEGVRLSITSRATGFPLRGTPADALTLTETPTGGGGQSLSPSLARAATNARVSVNGESFSSRDDSLTGAVPGFTLSVKQLSPGGETIFVPTPKRPAINVENELDRILQAQLLTTRGLAPSEEGKLNQTKAKRTPVDRMQESRKPAPAGGNESSRADIMKKLTAVDDIFGGLRSASQLLAGMSTARSGAGGVAVSSG